MKVHYQLTSDTGLPSRQTPDASGYDLEAAMGARMAPGDRCVVGTGMHLAIPRGYEAQIRPRSGLAVKYGVTVLNAPGTVDADYRGEVMVCLINLGRQHVYVKPGMRIAQLVFARVEYPVLAEAGPDGLPTTKRGSGGLGSTGVL